jgi:hypothetical protein
MTVFYPNTLTTMNNYIFTIRYPDKCIPAILLWIIIFFTSCQSGSGRSGYQQFTSEISRVSKKDLTRYKAIFLIPFYGCTGCISTAENYLIMNYDEGRKKNILFIITGHDSLKSAKLRLGEAASNPDVYIDTDKVIDWNYLKQYPKLLLLQNGQVISEKEASADTPDIYEDLDQIANL